MVSLKLLLMPADIQEQMIIQDLRSILQMQKISVRVIIRNISKLTAKRYMLQDFLKVRKMARLKARLKA